MKAKVNLELLRTTNFDSGSLGLMAMVVHQFSSDGTYRVSVMEKGNSVTEITFKVDEKSDVMQLNIDLAQVAREKKARSRDSCCKGNKETPKVVSPKGYVLFHASSGGGYSVTVLKNGGDKVIFDSTRLNEGDLFAVSLLEPAEYSMENTLGKASGKIEVNLNPKKIKDINKLDTCYVDASEEMFDPSGIELTSSQGLVFRIKDTARIVIKKEVGSDVEYPRTKTRWEKFVAHKKKGSKKKE